MKGIFFVIGITGFVAGANMRVLDPLLPVIGMDFDVGATTVAMVVTSFSLSYALFQFVLGPLSEKFGKIQVMLGASLLAASMSLISSQVASLEQLIFVRFLTGAGVGGLIPLALAWIGDNTSYANRQTSLAKLIGFVMLGTIFGPSSSGLISDALGWRAVFFMYFILFCINSSMLFVMLRSANLSVRLRTKSRQDGWEFKSQLIILKDPWVRIVLLTVFIEGALFHGCHAFSGTYLQDTYGLSMSRAGVVVACFGVGAVCYTLCVTSLVKFFGQAGLVLGGGFGLCFCYMLMPWMPQWYFTIPLIFFSGFVFFMLHNTLQTCSSEMAPTKRGIALCFHGFSMLFGTAFGVMLTASLVGSFGFLWAYSFSGIGLVLLSIYFSAVLKKRNVKLSDPIESY